MYNYYFKRKYQMEKSRAKYYNEPVNRRLKRAAWIVISVAVLVQALSILFFDKLWGQGYLWARIISGLCALAFIILIIILNYRVHSAYHRDQNKHPLQRNDSGQQHE